MFIVYAPAVINCVHVFHVYPTDNHEWDFPEWEGLEARYEHCSFVAESCPQSLWVFGGAQQTGNRNSIQKIQLTGKIQIPSTHGYL